MNIRSIRSRIMIWYVLILALTFAVSGTFVYQTMGRAVRANLDDLLELRAEAIAGSIDTYWTVEYQEALKAGRPPESASKIDNVDFRKIAQRWVEERTNDPILLNLVVQIFGTGGDLIASSRDIPGTSLLPFEALDLSLPSSGRFLNVLGQFGAAGERALFRALAYPVPEGGRLAYVVRVLSPLAPIEAPLRALRLVLFLGLPLAVLVSGAVGTWLAGRTLRPVSRMVGSVRGISAENLEVRVAVPKTRDELQRLAETFNSMLERIAQGFSVQRQFWEDVAHELKTPLAIMKGELEVSLKADRSPGECRDVLASNLEEVERLIRLIDRMLTLACLDRGGAPLEMKVVDLGRIAGGVADEFRPLAEVQGIRFHYSGLDKKHVLGDDARLRVLFTILLDNALKYTPSGGTVTVGLETSGPLAKFTVSDTGQGIREEDLARIFQRFYRAAGPAVTSGFGLGLSIARAIAEGHGGRIEVQSRLGAGSTFSVILPLSQGV